MMSAFAKGHNQLWLHELSTELLSVVLRILKEEDADESSLLVNQNREYLREWLCWADQPNIPPIS